MKKELKSAKCSDQNSSDWPQHKTLYTNVQKFLLSWLVAFICSAKSTLISKMKVSFSQCDIHILWYYLHKKTRPVCEGLYSVICYCVRAFGGDMVCRPQVACGLNHTLVVSTDGMMVWAFGDGDYGKLGLGNSTAKSSPQVGAVVPLTVNMRPRHRCVPITMRNQWEQSSRLNWIPVVTS